MICFEIVVFIDDIFYGAETSGVYMKVLIQTIKNINTLFHYDNFSRNVSEFSEVNELFVEIITLMFHYLYIFLLEIRLF